jgi:hypothetical protein
MALHLIKLAVGVIDLAQMKRLQANRRKERRQGPRTPHWVYTRNTPRRPDELLDGGSLYWVIKGQVACRERLLAIEPFRDKAGIGRCRIVLEPKIVPVLPRPMRPFQGWRYLPAEDAPKDLGKSGASIAAMPEKLRRELRELGLL